MLVFAEGGGGGGGGSGGPREKPSEQSREPTQTEPTYGVRTGNRAYVTLVGGECFHHCAIPAHPARTINSTVKTKFGIYCV